MHMLAGRCDGKDWVPKANLLANLLLGQHKPWNR